MMVNEILDNLGFVWKKLWIVDKLAYSE